MKKKTKKLIESLVIDIFAIGLILVVFAYFHHVMPRTYETVAQTPAQTDDTGDDVSWKTKFADKFLVSEVTDTGYKSANISVEVTKMYDGVNTVYVEDIYITDIKYLRSAFAKDTFGRSVTERTLTMAENNEAVAAINGDSYGLGYSSAVIRNGVLYRDAAYDDILVLYNDGTMKVIPESTFSGETEMANGAWQAWSFGPGLLDENGNAMTNIYSVVAETNPRAAIGYYEPGHYCFVVVDGRQSGYSQGMTMDELSALFAQLGCKLAYNLDGGATAEMTFMDATVNRPSGGGRETSDIILIREWND